MAFCLYSGGQSTHIAHHEETIFNFIGGSNYPKLNRLKEHLYDDPAFTSSEANELVHELIGLRSVIAEENSSRYLIEVIDRLLPFFSQAYLNGVSVTSVSD